MYGMGDGSRKSSVSRGRGINAVHYAAFMPRKPLDTAEIAVINGVGGAGLHGCLRELALYCLH